MTEEQEEKLRIKQSLDLIFEMKVKEIMETITVGDTILVVTDDRWEYMRSAFRKFEDAMHKFGFHTYARVGFQQIRMAGNTVIWFLNDEHDVLGHNPAGVMYIRFNSLIGGRPGNIGAVHKTVMTVIRKDRCRFFMNADL